MTANITVSSGLARFCSACGGETDRTVFLKHAPDVVLALCQACTDELRDRLAIFDNRKPVDRQKPAPEVAVSGPPVVGTCSCAGCGEEPDRTVSIGGSANWVAYLCKDCGGALTHQLAEFNMATFGERSDWESYGERNGPPPVVSEPKAAETEPPSEPDDAPHVVSLKGGVIGGAHAWTNGIVHLSVNGERRWSGGVQVQCGDEISAVFEAEPTERTEKDPSNDAKPRPPAAGDACDCGPPWGPGTVRVEDRDGKFHIAGCPELGPFPDVGAMSDHEVERTRRLLEGDATDIPPINETDPVARHQALARRDRIWLATVDRVKADRDKARNELKLQREMREAGVDVDTVRIVGRAFLPSAGFADWKDPVEVWERKSLVHNIMRTFGVNDVIDAPDRLRDEPFRMEVIEQRDEARRRLEAATQLIDEVSTRVPYPSEEHAALREIARTVNGGTDDSKSPRWWSRVEHDDALENLLAERDKANNRIDGLEVRLMEARSLITQVADDSGSFKLQIDKASLRDFLVNPEADYSDRWVSKESSVSTGAFNALGEQTDALRKELEMRCGCRFDDDRLLREACVLHMNLFAQKETDTAKAVLDKALETMVPKEERQEELRQAGRNVIAAWKERDQAREKCKKWKRKAKRRKARALLGMDGDDVKKIRDILRPGWRDEDSGNHWDMLRDIAEILFGEGA